MPADPEPWGFEWRRALLLSEVREGDRVLDVGCGTGRFAELVNAVGVEIAEEPVRRARERGVDARLLEPEGTLPVGHREFDLVWCSEVLEHVPDALGLLQECRRALASGGRLLVTTPAHPWLRRVAIAALRFDSHFDPLGQHVRFFTRPSLERTLRSAGFEEIGIRSRAATLIARAVRP